MEFVSELSAAAETDPSIVNTAGSDVCPMTNLHSPSSFKITSSKETVLSNSVLLRRRLCAFTLWATVLHSVTFTLFSSVSLQMVTILLLTEKPLDWLKPSDIHVAFSCKMQNGGIKAKYVLPKVSLTYWPMGRVGLILYNSLIPSLLIGICSMDLIHNGFPRKYKFLSFYNGFGQQSYHCAWLHDLLIKQFVDINSSRDSYGEQGILHGSLLSNLNQSEYDLSTIPSLVFLIRQSLKYNP